MNTMPHPSKEMVREWLKNQISQHRPPPSPQQIQDELGWHCQQNDAKRNTTQPQ